MSRGAMSRKIGLYVLLGVAALGGLFGLFRLLFEKEETEVSTPATAAARVNRLLATERLLNALELPTRSVRGPVSLPPTDHALVLVTSRQAAGVDRTEWLLDWVQEGGHLIMSPRRWEDARDTLYVDDIDLGEDQEETDTEEGQEETEENHQEEADDEDDKDEILLDPLLKALGMKVKHFEHDSIEVIRLRPAQSKAALEVAIPSSPRLVPAKRPHFQSGRGVLARYRHGGGWVTVLSDARFLDNTRIGEHQHASFLWSLVTTPERPAGVWLVYQDQVSGLRRLLFQRAWMVFVSGSLLLAAWLWARGASFGPALRPPPNTRRSLREHLGATAEFLWRRGQGAALVASERQAVLHAVRHQYPAWNSLSEKERLRFLAELSGVHGPLLVEALEGSVANHPETFIRMISTLEKVRRSL